MRKTIRVIHGKRGGIQKRGGKGGEVKGRYTCEELGQTWILNHEKQGARETRRRSKKRRAKRKSKEGIKEGAGKTQDSIPH